MTYNPFDKSPFDILTVEDLEKLIENSVAEGYYVEYKRQFVKNEKIAHSISSFANAYGGWYIVGVKTNEHNIATEICGFNLSDYSDPIDKIREIVKSNIDPVPLFYSQVIQLDEEKAVLVVFIPDNQDKPFICKNGRVYRRLADSSDPISETNRYALDKLYEEGKEINKKYLKFCQDERIHETNNGWVQVFLSPYPLGILNQSKLKTWTTEDLEKIIKLSKQQINIDLFQSIGLTGSVPFNAGQTSLKSLIFRQNNNYLGFNSLEFELFNNFNARFLIPLEYCKLSQQDIFHNLSKLIQKIVRKIYFLEEDEIKNIESTPLLFFDIGKLYLGIINLISLYQNILDDRSPIKQIELTIKIEKARKSIPFFNSNQWAEHIHKFGVPIIYKDLILINKNNGRGWQFNYDVKLSRNICVLVGNSFGLPLEFTSKIITESIVKIEKVKSEN